VAIVVRARLAHLGFEARVVGGVEIIVPPLCDVPAGEFLMGSDPTQDVDARPEEQPQHRVTLDAFQIARFPVTVAEYAYFVRAGSAPPEWWDDGRGGADCPVVGVSWHDAVAYAAWLAHVTGARWRLPSEAEWEKAARWDPAAGRARLYPWGDAFDQERCITAGAGGGGATPVGHYAERGDASPCGAHDLAGDVWEWTSSLYEPYPYRADDGRARAEAIGGRVLRGGSWAHLPRHARAARRNAVRPAGLGADIGFRLAHSAPRA
jgi:formylglycine-generating enzyme required for sulfatase activity